MGVIQGFLDTNWMGRVVLILLLVAQIFNWLSMCMNDWGLFDSNPLNNKDRKGFGVWKECGNQEPSANCVELDGWRLKWYGAFQGFAIFAFMSVNVAFCLTILLLYVPPCKGSRELAIGSAIACFITTVFYIVAIIIFGVRFDRSFDAGFDREILQSGFYFAIIVAILTLVAGICAVVGITSKQQVGPSSGGRHGRGVDEEGQGQQLQQTQKKQKKKKKQDEQQQEY
ncbi:unnamed protein product [Lymnaea stagnalis]|uniref:Uncharacterized protein n=1 Tax=Lymnaea stagnalis TaxID=6523 RepID=A0AAV2IAN6_LYMST